MGYSERDSVVRVDLFKESGKWAYTIALDMNAWYDHPKGPKEAVREALKAHKHWGSSYVYYTVVCLEPFHKTSFPVLFEGSE